MLRVTPSIILADTEIELRMVRSPGPGGQHVNKAATAVHLRFDIDSSSLPVDVKTRLLSIRDTRISKDGIIVIKASEYRSQNKNRDEALQRLAALIRRATVRRKKRRPTAPGRRAKEKRLQKKTKRGKIKEQRRKVLPDS